MKKFFYPLILIVLIFFSAGLVYAGENGTTLKEATVSITPHWLKEFKWTIDKSVTPNSWDLFKGDSGISQYTVTLTKDAGTESAWIDGQICVTNAGAVATENLAINAELRDGIPPPNDLIAFATVDISGNPVLDPGENGCYAYRINVPLPTHAGGTYKVTPNITITNHSGSIGTPFGPRPSNTTVFPSFPMLVNDNVHVSDTNGGSWIFSNSGSQTYSNTFTCNANVGKNDNTATITETEQSASASVTVNCYKLGVTKTSKTSLVRTYTWLLDKIGDQDNLTLALDQTFLVNYIVTPSATFIDSNWKTEGTIAVHNPAPFSGILNSVTDVVSPEITGVVTCGVTFPYTLGPDNTLSCSYTADLGDNTTRINTATVILQNYIYNKEKNSTADGTTGFSGTATVTFADPTITDVDKCITVMDDKTGALGSICYEDLPKSFIYSKYIGPYTVCGNQEDTNTASFVTKTTGTTGQDQYTVHSSIPCVTGCTLTIGYWKNHAGFGKQKDALTNLLPQGFGSTGILGKYCVALPLSTSICITTAQQAVDYLGMRVYGTPSNGITKLYAQLLGAKLNISNGASNTTIAPTILAADAFLTRKNYLDWSGLLKSKQNEILTWASKLDSFNNGLTAVPHCSE